MAVAVDFFEITPRNWRARWTISVDVMRELSRYSDPDEMYHVFARRMSQLYPTSRQVSLTRRGLDRPHARVTRFNLWADASTRSRSRTGCRSCPAGFWRTCFTPTSRG